MSYTLASTTGLCLLALDGGGRQQAGLSSVNPCEVFDLIGGTSAGGLIAITLGRLEMTVEACIAAYEELMKAIFEKKSSRLPVGWSGRTKAQFDSGKLRKAIEKVIRDSGASIEDLFNDGQDRGCRVFICTVAHETSGTTRLRSYDLPDRPNISATICEAALATSAATGFFDPVNVGSRRFVDGALGTNNPAEEVEEKAANIWCSESRELMSLTKCFISVGTGNRGKKALEDNMLKLLSKTLVDMVTETERTEKRGLRGIGLAEYKEQGAIQAATNEYLEHPQQSVRVRDCVLHLKDKQNRADTAFAAVVKEYTIRMNQLQIKGFQNIPFAQNRRFVDRKKQLDLLQNELLGDCGAAKVAMVSLGGTGKTQIALELAYKMQEITPDCSVIWIPAISMETIEQAYKGQGPSPTPSEPKKKGASRWLLIFDNADDVDMWTGRDGYPRLLDFLPRSDLGRIVFTIRDRKTAVKLAQKNVVHLAETDEEMGLQLLYRHLIDQANDRRIATRLLAKLAYLPLAIVQAAAYEQDVIDLLSEDFEEEGRYSDRKDPVATTWLISFEQIRRRDTLAADYLAFMSCVEPIDIPESLLPPGRSRKRETDAIGLLNAYSFVAKRSGKLTLDVHRLVHFATRSWLRVRDSSVRWTLKAMRRLKNVFPNDDHHANRSAWRLYLPHARRLLDATKEEDAEIRTELLYKFAMCLDSDGKYIEAGISLFEVMQIWQKELGEEHPLTLISMNNLALIYKNQGRWKEAEELQLQKLEITRRELGEDHPSTLISMNNLASTYTKQGQWKKAEELQVPVLKITKRELGEEHSLTLISMGNLALIYVEQDRCKEVEESQVQELKITKRELGEDHPETLTSMNNLALMYAEQGRWKEAEELQVQEHPETLTAMSNLAFTYNGQGRFSNAIELMEKCALLSQQFLGIGHPHTISRSAFLKSWEAEQADSNDEYTE
ncbi:FabD/lysophospholipase-like protein [Mytilinidion resinicola]|uniref:FabD/lysophospholipase-like protein n=1 Tax=Mytilinidion resinicola TaxID=574789 RepID=A0A6A6YL75_9PEZI|nr:FabD/lysophospholipase-like protein [Mytilinidion resinicola]KAF2809299.1 FabD/lysophospholipase-like protein [Mytilinidion resinicola]